MLMYVPIVYGFLPEINVFGFAISCTLFLCLSSSTLSGFDIRLNFILIYIICIPCFSTIHLKSSV